MGWAGFDPHPALSQQAERLLAFTGARGKPSGRTASGSRRDTKQRAGPRHGWRSGSHVDCKPEACSQRPERSFQALAMPGPATPPPASGPTGVLPAGIKGLVISQLKMEGVVHEEATNSMIALVTNSGKRAYFLRVNDSVHNGMVSKITPDAIYFRENTLDWSGRTSTHEVAIKLGSVRGEGR